MRSLCEELRCRTVTCLECDQLASKGLALLNARGETSAPVVDDNGVLVGIFLAKLVPPEDRELEVEDAMSTNVVAAHQPTTVAEVARLMAAHNLDRLPIVAEDGRVVGVASAMDLVRWMARRTLDLEVERAGGSARANLHPPRPSPC